ncbi:MAG: hypothetical protein ACFFD8_06980 [Candidatus Thorarchaeota archaeon]
MRKKKRNRLFLVIAVASILAIILALVIFSGSPFSQDVTPGVKVGDEFIYDITSSWNSDDPNATLVDYYVELNMTEWYKITVTDVNGTKVSIKTIWRFANETEIESNSNIDVKTGILYPSNSFWAIYASNLEKNDLIRPSGLTRAVVNETETKDFVSGIREINVVSLTEQYYDADDPTYSTTWTDYMNTKFDKETGILVEFHDISIYTNPGQIMTISWILKETNVWDV